MYAHSRVMHMHVVVAFSLLCPVHQYTHSSKVRLLHSLPTCMIVKYVVEFGLCTVLLDLVHFHYLLLPSIYQLIYQWTPFKFQFHYLCTSTHNVTMETEFTNVTINGPFTVGEECEVQVKACLRNDGCAWAVTSKALPFTGMYQDMCMCM